MCSLSYRVHIDQNLLILGVKDHAFGLSLIADRSLYDKANDSEAAQNKKFI